MGAALLIPKATGQPLVFIKAGEARLVVLVLETLPAKQLLQLILNVGLDKWNQVQRVMHLHPQKLLIPDFVNQDIDQGEVIIRFSITMLAPNICKQCCVNA